MSVPKNARGRRLIGDGRPCVMCGAPANGTGNPGMCAGCETDDWGVMEYLAQKPRRS